MRDAIRWALILSALVHVAVQAQGAWECGRWGLRQAGALGVANPNGSASLTGCYLAIVAPLAPWPLWPVFALGLWWSGSWLALGALGAASIWNWPVPMVWGPIVASSLLGGLLVAFRVPIAGRAAGEWLPRGDSWDSITQRLRTWRLILATLPAVMPWGRRPLSWDLHRYQAAAGQPMPDAAFNEYLQVSYEYGLIGVVALVGGALLVCPHFRHGDGFSVALVVWTLTMGGSLTLRTWPFPAVGGLLVLGAWL